MKKYLRLIIFLLLSLPIKAEALEPGTLLYRTSSDAKVYGKNADYLIESSYGVANKVNSGHVGIYVGKVDGIDYVVEALGDGIVKTPAAYFVNLEQGEEFLGAKIPRLANPWQRAKAVSIAKSLAERGFSYDINFKEQKGPLSGQWTCVGLAEKIYESANALYPERLSALEYDKEKYAVDITKDAYDNFSIYNNQGDVFSTVFEFSKINRQKNTILPLPELIGFNAGKEVAGERYIFLPYTQFLQSSLKETPVNIKISSHFRSSDIRGKSSTLKTAITWSLINNPVSSVKKIVNDLSTLFTKKTTEEKVAEIDKKDLEAKTIGVKDYDLELDYEENEIVAKEEGLTDEGLSLLISKVSAEGLDDYIELYNYGSFDINLAESGVRLHKAYQSENFPIILRFNEEADFQLNTSLVIKPQSRFLIVRDKASAELKSRADVIALRPSFAWTGNGYTLYLAKGVVSSDSDEDILDKVGFGEAKYFYQKPAIEIIENFVLARKGSHQNTKHNFNDFELERIRSEAIIEKIETVVAEEKKNQTKVQKVETVERDIESVHFKTEIEEVEEPEQKETIIEPDLELTLLISKISAQALDDYIELYNYGENDIDLVEHELRLHKAYQSNNFPIIIRFSSEADLSFKTDTTIKAKSSYLIARDKASEDIKEKADAIALRPSFNWTKSGYTLFLAKGPVSSDNDEDIIDKVGFGEAKFYLQKPALEIADNHILVRKSNYQNTLNNYNDFTLLRVREDEEIVEEEEEVVEEEEIVEEEEEEEIVEEEEEEDVIEEEEEEVIEEEKVVDLTLVISKISAEGNNDFVELFNYGENDINLEAQTIRLHKAYQSNNFPILLRFDNNTDALYPSGKIIKAQSPYLIVRNSADEKWLNQADAIALRSEFTFTGDGYTLYLAKDTVSSDDDVDILDKVGFGGAQFYYHQAAEEILDGHALKRKALASSTLEDIIAGGLHENLSPIYNSYNNRFDFLLWPLSNVLAVNYNSVLTLNYSPPGFTPFSSLESLEIADISHLWHFDDCHGNLAIDELSRFKPNPLYITSNGPWLSNFWGCSRHLDYNYEPFRVELPEIINGNEFSLAFMYKVKDNYSRIRARLFGNEEERELNVRFFSHQTEFNSGFPGVSGRITHDPWLINEDWQRIVISFNKLAENSHAWYLEVNGNQIFSHLFNGLLPSYSNFELHADSGRVDFDEIALWHRGLSVEERSSLAEFKPLAPATHYEEQIEPALKYAWLFDEAQGTTTVSVVGDLDLEIDFNALVVDGRRVNALRSSKYLSQVSQDLEHSISGGETSLSFWWKNSAYPDNPLTYIILAEDEADHFGLMLQSNSASYIFQQSGGSLCSYDFADTWHHLALSYNKYFHTLSFYINGEKCYSQQFIPYLAPEPEFNRLKIISQLGQSDFDELKIWQGALQDSQVSFEYNLSD